jgi:hypothetical protein
MNDPAFERHPGLLLRQRRRLQLPPFRISSGSRTEVRSTLWWRKGDSNPRSRRRGEAVPTRAIWVFSREPTERPIFADDDPAHRRPKRISPLNCASDLECKIAGLVSSAGRQEPLPLMPRHPGSGKRLPIDFADMLRSSMGELKAYAFAMPPR